jgi:hypothetical protein
MFATTGDFLIRLKKSPSKYVTARNETIEKNVTIHNYPINLTPTYVRSAAYNFTSVHRHQYCLQMRIRFISRCHSSNLVQCLDVELNVAETTKCRLVEKDNSNIDKMTMYRPTRAILAVS